MRPARVASDADNDRSLDILETTVAFALQELPPSPGQTSAPSTGASPAPAESAPGGGLGLLFPLLLFLPLIAMMWWSSRSQQKRQQKLLSELAKGDVVLTQGGLRGKLVEMGDRFAKVELSPGVKVEVLRTSILGKDSPETATQLEKK